MAAQQPSSPSDASSVASFSQSLIGKADKIIDLSFHHPFVTALADGSLPLSAFRLYVLNDSYYLQNFARVQCLGAASALHLADLDDMARHARATYEAEMGLHGRFFTALGITAEERAAHVPSPSAVAYVNHLYACCGGSGGSGGSGGGAGGAASGGGGGSGGSDAALGLVLAAILPCYVVYLKVAQRFKGAAPAHPIYSDWLSTYAGDWFDGLVQEQCARLDRIASNPAALGSDALRAMEQAFLRSCQYETMFWEAAWTGERWPGQE